MATESNNIQINSFGKGMNSDTSLDMIQDGQYTFGKNIRITTNALLNGIIDSNSTEGIITPIDEGTDVTPDSIYTSDYRILATASIDDIGAVIILKGNQWYVYRIDFGDQIKFSLQFTSEELTEDQLNNMNKKFSVVINRELENVVKLYIADGIHQLMQINLKDDDYNNSITGNTDNITSNHIYPSKQIRIEKQTSGSLKTSQVQYTYRLYKKYGISSRLAPLTNKIQIIDGNRNKEEGNAQNTITSIGLQISVPVSSLGIDTNLFDHVQIYRLNYVRPQENAFVELIYDSFIKEDNVVIIDNGKTSLKTMTIDELAAINSMILVPKNVEQSQNYMFISNIKDETVLRMDKEHINVDSRAYQRKYDTTGGGIPDGFLLRNNNNPTNREQFIHVHNINDIQDGYDVNPYSVMNPDAGDNIYDIWQACKYKREGNNYFLGGEGKNVSWKFVTTSIAIHDRFNQYSSVPPYATGNQPHAALYYLDSNNNKVPANLTTANYLAQRGISAIKSLEYDDIIGSSMFRSLRRDEVYRYGIVYYDKYGKRSDVQWIGDIRTPNTKECPNVSGTFGQQNGVSYNISGTLNARLIFEYADEFFQANQYIEHNKYVLRPVTGLYQHIDGNKIIRLQITGTRIGNKSINEFQNRVGRTFTPDIRLNVNGQWYDQGQTVSISGGANVYVLYNDMKSDIPNRKKPDQDICDGVGEVKHYYDRSFNNREFFKKVVACAKDFGGIYDSGSWDDVGFDTGIDVMINIQDENYESLLKLNANPLGIKFDISVPKDTGITSYQIVRCSKQSEYSKTLMQCALSRPVRQNYSGYETTASLKSPYYPTPFLCSQYLWTHTYFDGQGVEASNNLFSIHSSEISIFPEDSKSLISKNDTTVKPLSFAYQDSLYAITYALSGYINQSTEVFGPNERYGIWFNRHATRGANEERGAMDFKSGSTCNLYLYNLVSNMYNFDGWTMYPEVATIEEVVTAQNPTWDKGFTNIQFNGSKIVGGVKAYKSYVSTVKTDQYVNWVCNGMYNLRISSNESQIGLANDGEKVFTYLDSDNEFTKQRGYKSSGWVGPGPKCMLIRLANPGGIFLNSIRVNPSQNPTIGSLICNIQHTAQQFAGFTDQEKQFDIYYGFGNYGQLTDDGKGNMTGSIIVFDGDVYNLPCELVSMYKTYNFNSIRDTIPSAQIVNYVPLETKINTFFDYGMNYRNTQSPNLQSEPGEITGVCSQDRPQHQYNAIYSDNNVSNDVYNAQSEEWTDQNFTQRIFYSQLKTNGEYVDNWSDFRALDYIDADTRYGDITHMLTNKDIIYFWQQQAFGKLSVNERSLITDNNSNTIQLGQGGVLQRTDYISTVYGLRKDDRSAINTQDGIFWIDIMNKSILVSQNSQVVNYGERLNVQNVINSNISQDIPDIEFDTQNQELLCKCLENGEQLVFNTKLGCATSVYTRNYEDTIKYNNIIYGLSSDSKIIQYNYIKEKNHNLPSMLQFVVNQVPSVTKVFDNQQINTLKREYDENYAKNFMIDKQIIFTTNLDESKYDHQQNTITDREGNICYTIPRINNSMYGNRLRGRWMKVTMIDDNPKYDYSISHILTKFRQSFN